MSEINQSSNEVWFLNWRVLLVIGLTILNIAATTIVVLQKANDDCSSYAITVTGGKMTAESFMSVISSTQDGTDVAVIDTTIVDVPGTGLKIHRDEGEGRLCLTGNTFVKEGL